MVLLAGGTGGAKLARGMLDEVGSDLVVIANTGDDVEIHGGYVSPDPDLVLYWLADRIDERGWGIRGDTFAVMDALRELGEDVWFNLGDQDLAVCLQRARRLAEGARLTETLEELRAALGVPARVLPPTDAPVRTHVRARGEWFGFQEFMIREGARGPVEGVEVLGAGPATASPEVLEAIASASAVVIGPSNPVISIGPILAVGGIADALRATEAPVVAVSPLVHGAVLKGPTDLFMEWAGHPLSADGIVAHYSGLIDGLVSDERASRRADARDRRRDGRRGRPPPRRARDAGVLRRAARVRSATRCVPWPSFPSSRSAGRSSGSARRSSTARELAAAMVGDVLDALGAVRGLDGIVVVSAEALPASRASTAVEVVHDPVEAGQSRRRQGASGRRSRGARSGCCSCPATARRSTRRRSTSCWPRPSPAS